MATTSNTTKAKVDNNNLTRTKSLGKKPKQPSSVSSEDGSDQKPEKPLPNYLKPTISSRPDPVKFLKKNDQDNQKLLRRRSFDRPPPSLTSASTPSPRIQKTLNASPSLPRDKPAVPREKPATATRSSSFHGSRGVPRGSTSVKSPHVAPKKSGLSSSSTSLKSKKEGSEKKAPEKEIALDTASLSSAQEDEEEIPKVESDVQVADDIEEAKDEKENKEVHVEVVHGDASGEENENDGSTLVAPVVEDIVVVVAKENEREEEEEEILVNEHNSEEKIEEKKEQENKGELTDLEVIPKIDEGETSEKVDADMKPKEVEKVEEVESVKETREEKEEVEEEKEVNREEKEEVKDEEKEKDKIKEESGEGKKKEIVKGKKESPSAYNDVIASKMQENPRKNKVLALAGAFQTVIDYETAASK
ncbi:calmodulin-binding protein-related [Raphanus sativus]|uniref:Uncharacterized protein LOC108852216 n=1 Tax=Raphanus sativus TaxID=3726 RepID=A0A6J0NBJ9_RAPSA|nr:uncharacterized protein LOC108852216 [Raphanus sativus]KAJ4900527.1 calmodulin-binding protein-related [Raphanus sativus]